MRIQNSFKNMAFGLSGQIIISLMGFIVRTIFIKELGMDYLGLNSLFTSILVMLSVANLGFDSAIVYSLYKPLADKDYIKIQALMNLYKKAYRMVGSAILINGLCLMPFLPLIVGKDTNIQNINTFYLLFLINSVLSYFLIYKKSIIIADQKNYIISKIHTAATVTLNLFQLLQLVVVGDYLFYLTIQIVFNSLENLYVAYKANKLYPFLKEKNNNKLSAGDRKSFFQNLYALMLYKISGVIISGTDNIIISIFIGVHFVGVYSNYLLILGTVSMMLGFIFSSLTASVGNLIVSEDTDKKYLIFRVINFSNFWFFGMCSICLWALINPFISLWIGDQYLLNKLVVLAIIINFYTAGMQYASSIYRETTGLFKKGKYRPLFAAVINIAVSVFLASYIGIAGVIYGTVISRLCIYFWYDPYVIFKYVFNRKVKSYFGRYLIYASLVTICAGIMDYLVKSLYTGNVFLFFLFCLIGLVISNLVFYTVFRKSEEFVYLRGVFSMLIGKRRAHLTSKVS
ncbi:lipopolysaccharide biosynthesis protein [Mesobacillus harenae]|uniref:lipopolysaccharide biosynthesis protein n=1 Tax=Mesobacillus harenae TaxID=2213203 RepID=UPI00158107FA|nr:sugar translocase [Mesobacillus harenae]